MKSRFAVVMLTLSVAVAAHAASTWPAACGRDDIEFRVKTDKKAAAPGDPAPGMARVYFIESLSEKFASAPTARFASDGLWLGADRGNSYFTASLAPGEHKICASRQSPAAADKENRDVTTLKVEAGMVYYVEFKLTRTEIGGAAMQGGAMLPGQYPGSMTAKDRPTMDTVSFRQLTPEEGRARLSKLPQSSFNQH